MKIAIDIGGAISKYPEIFREMISAFRAAGAETFILTDQHPREAVLATLAANGFEFDAAHVLCAEYDRFADACKAVLLREHGIDIFVDDQPGYLAWPWATPAPLRLRVEPDQRRPYWAPEWKCDGGDFGRRCFCEGV